VFIFDIYLCNCCRFGSRVSCSDWARRPHSLSRMGVKAVGVVEEARAGRGPFKSSPKEVTTELAPSDASSDGLQGSEDIAGGENEEAATAYGEGETERNSKRRGREDAEAATAETPSSRTLPTRRAKRMATRLLAEALGTTQEVSTDPSVLPFDVVFPMLEARGWGVKAGDQDGVQWIYVKDKLIQFDRNLQMKNMDFFESEEDVLNYLSMDAELRDDVAQEWEAKNEDELKEASMNARKDLEVQKALQRARNAKRRRARVGPVCMPASKKDEILSAGSPGDCVVFQETFQTLPMLNYEEWSKYWNHLLEIHGGTRLLTELGWPRDESVRDYERYRAGLSSPSFAQSLISFANIQSKDRYLELGCGVGASILPIAALTGCTAVGIESDINRARAATKFNRNLQIELDQHNMHGGYIRIIHGDFFAEKFLPLIMAASVIQVSNDPSMYLNSELRELNRFIENIALHSKLGTRIITLMPIKNLHSRLYDGCLSRAVYMTVPNVATWCSERIQLVVYQKRSTFWACSFCQAYNSLLKDDNRTPQSICVACQKDATEHTDCSTNNTDI